LIYVVLPVPGLPKISKGDLFYVLYMHFNTKKTIFFIVYF